MTLVSLTDCCHRLAVDPKTLRRWMSLSQMSALPHPIDARLKCLTGEQVQQLAATHHRTLPDYNGLHFQPEISAPVTPTSVVNAPVFSDVLPDFSALISDLTKQLGSLQAHVATLQHQLTLLTDQLQKEQQWRVNEALTLQEKSLEPSKEKSQEKSLESSREKSLEPSKEKESARAVANTPAKDRRKLPHILPLVEYGARGAYVVICPERGRLTFEPDSPEWFAREINSSFFPFYRTTGTFYCPPRGMSTNEGMACLAPYPQSVLQLSNRQN